MTGMRFLFTLFSLLCSLSAAFFHRSQVPRLELLKVFAAPTQAAIAKAQAAAEAATKEFGIKSAQARVAWDTVEELQAAASHGVVIPNLDEECDLSDSERCKNYESAMAELQQIIKSAGATENAIFSAEALAKQNAQLMEENLKLKAQLSAMK